MGKDTTKEMTSGSTMKLILGFAVPLLMGMLFQQVYGLVDTIIVGRFLGVSALAAVGATGSINFLIIGFCQGIQAAAPVDSHVTPEPWDMPGYDAQVIMAAGAFVSGSSIELSADGPIKPPYAVYFQGGLTWQHAKFGILKSLQALLQKGIVTEEQIRQAI